MTTLHIPLPTFTLGFDLIRPRLLIAITLAMSASTGCRETPVVPAVTEPVSERVDTAVAEPEPSPPPPPPWTAVDAPRQNSAALITGSWLGSGENGRPNLAPQFFPEVYAEFPGVFTFRANHLRQNATSATTGFNVGKIIKRWERKTRTGTSKPAGSTMQNWGGGAGWTGQPALVQWPRESKLAMNLKPEHIDNPSFVEVIQASLDGHVYFLDLETGEPSRTSTFFNPLTKAFDTNTINIRNPIKGSVSIDPRGAPLLYVGQGIPEGHGFGFRVFSLIDGKRLLYLNGKDTDAYRRWGAFDSAALINRTSDTFFVPGENGLLYAGKLNLDWTPGEKTLTINPSTYRYRYRVSGNTGRKKGMENSITAWKNLIWFADNGGSVICMDLTTYQPVWAWFGSEADDTNATLALDFDDGKPVLYAGTEVEYQRDKTKKSWIHKFDGLTGQVKWSYGIVARPEVKGVNLSGGVYGSPAVGTGDVSDRIFVPVAEVNAPGRGVLLALNKQDGTEMWRADMPKQTWSSPVFVTNHEGKGYLVVGDSVGSLHLFDASNGERVHQINVGANIEASPAVFGNRIVVSTRGNAIFGFELR